MANSFGLPSAKTGPSLRPPRFRAIRTIAALILREMSSTYGRSPGGYIWAILSPLGAILIMSFAFSFMVRSPALGTSFILFYATGYLPYNLYMQLTAKIGTALRYSQALMSYPGVTWLHALLGRLILNTLTLTMVFCIVIIGITMAVDTRTVIDIRPILDGLLLATLTGFGIGMMNALLVGLFPIWERIWIIITRPLFLISGILFLYEDMPKVGQDFLWWNPLIHATALIRTGFYPTYHASFVSLPYCYGFALTLITLALIFLRKSFRTVMEQ